MLIFAYFFRSFSRLLVMKINLTGYTKYLGDVRRLEYAAWEASSALPLILSTLNTSRELLEFFLINSGKRLL